MVRYRVTKNYSIAERSADEVKGADTNTQIAPDFSNRLKKNIGKIGKWARKEKLDATASMTQTFLNIT